MCWRRRAAWRSQAEGQRVGDSIHGHEILAEAEEISDPLVVVKSGIHKAQRIFF